MHQQLGLTGYNQPAVPMQPPDLACVVQQESAVQVTAIVVRQLAVPDLCSSNLVWWATTSEG